VMQRCGSYNTDGARRIVNVDLMNGTNILFFVVVLFGLLHMSGCMDGASYSPSEEETRAKSFLTAPRKGGLYVIRKSVFTGCIYDCVLSLEGTERGSMKNNTFMYFEVEPGTHEVAVHHIQYAPVTATPFQIEVKAGRCTFVEYCPKTFTLNFVWSALDEMEGVAKVRSLRMCRDRVTGLRNRAPDKDRELVQAAKEGNLPVARALLSGGTGADAYDDEGTALVMAVRGNHTEIVKILLDNGADVNENNTFYQTSPMLIAAEKRTTRDEQGNYTEIVTKILLDNGADVNEDDTFYQMSPMLIASEKGNAEIVKLLLKKNANVNTHTSLVGFTPLMKAVEYNHTEVVKLLLDSGAEVNAKTQDYDTTALILAAQRGYEDIVRMLLEKGADVNIKSFEYFVMKNIKDVTFPEIAYRSLGNKDYTALKAAKENGHTVIVQLLEKAGAKE